MQKLVRRPSKRLILGKTVKEKKPAFIAFEDIKNKKKSETKSF
jgi:hypothetical protein